MQIRKFSSRTVPEALAQVRRELGEDAVILSTRPARSGRGFEVLATVDDGVPAHARGQSEVVPLAQRLRARAISGELLLDERNDDHAVAVTDESPEARIEDAARPSARPRSSAPALSVVPPVASKEEEAGSANRASLLTELEALRGRLETMTDVLLTTTPQDLTPTGRRLHLRLTETGLDGRLATALVRRAEKAGDNLESGLERALAAAVRCGGDLETGLGQQVVALVGPTGVGKTTTCAKLAARWLLQEGRSVALVSADGYRVGGSNQLAFYAEILEVPFYAVHDRRSFQTALAACGSAEIVIVDTTGRGPSDIDGAREIEDLVTSDPRTQSWLVLSAVAKTVDNLAAVRTFGRVHPSGLVLTKLDETSAHGACLSAAVRSALPLRFLTDGQTVPDDLVVARPSTIPDLLLKGGARAAKRA